MTVDPHKTLTALLYTLKPQKKTLTPNPQAQKQEAFRISGFGFRVEGIAARLRFGM